ncbi:hypothetical protein DFH08DRAFT_932305 [Mycena albidolilacea]|uniref:Uncharacterized protein n=1 Tax=Mycena albidolilacea TaxID=1033008 RepID=A0AAD7EXN2_9AGAR|nr:hypothetical protein DFH08DRAFT_932305 [Mycena albidolilacea]
MILHLARRRVTPVTRAPPTIKGTHLLCLLSIAAAANVQCASNAAAADNNIGGGGSTPSTGGIVGFAVAGGTTLICFIEFFVWKLTRKRQLDFDDSENIKWLELNAHGGGGDHALPVTQSAASSTGTTWSVLRSLPRARVADVQRGCARRAAGGLGCGWGADYDDANGSREPGSGDDVRWGWADGQPRADDVCGRADGEPGAAGGVWWDVRCSLPAQKDRDNDELAARRAGSRGRKRCRASLPPSASHVRIHALLTPYPPSFAPISTRAGGLRPRQAAVKR